MSLNLDRLPAPKIGVPLPSETRGRKSEPIPDAILDALRATHPLPKGHGGTFVLTNGEQDDKGRDSNVQQMVALLRRGAASLGYGISVRVGERDQPREGKTVVYFKAKDKTERKAKPVDIFVIDNDDDTFSEVDEGTEGARLATVGEAEALGYVYSNGAWLSAESGSDEQ